MSDDELAAETRNSLAPKGIDEDLIESDEPSSRTAWIRRRLDQLVPPRVGRRFLGVVTVAALALGLVAGYVVARLPAPGSSGAQANGSVTQTSSASDAGPIPFIRASPYDEGVIVFSVLDGLLTLQDLADLGERPLPTSYGLAIASGLDGICGRSMGGPAPAPGGSVPVPAQPPNPPGPAVRFLLAGGSLNELISPDLDVLSASTLRAQVQQAQVCADTEDLTVRTDGVLTGIGDEYAVFDVARTDLTSRALNTSIVVLVRVGGKLIEVALTSESSSAVPDALNRVLRIAEAAVARLLAG